MQPLIHGTYSIESAIAHKADFDSAVAMLREHFAEVQSKAPNYPPISDGEPEITESDGLVCFCATDEFWLYDIDLNFWNAFAAKFPMVSIELYYGSVFIGERCGMFTAKSGEIADVRYEDGSPEALDFSKKLNGAEG